MTIARAAEQAGVSVETIRFYEREGLIAQPPRPSSGYRIYPADTVRRIQFIKHCQELGFSLKETQEFLRLNDEGTPGCREACERVEDKIRQLEEKITALIELRSNLQSLLGSCPSGHCRVMEALNPLAGCGAEHQQC